jgi:hypothetical protein
VGRARSALPLDPKHNNFRPNGPTENSRARLSPLRGSLALLE